MKLRGNDKPNRFAPGDGPTDESDTIFGLGGADIIWGLGGNDHLYGGEGPDIINGGPGFDTAYYDDSAEGVIVNLQSGDGRYGTAEGDILSSIEALAGSRFDDIFFGHDLDDNSLRGNDGDDQISGFGGNDWLQGGVGRDRIDGGDGYDYADYSDATFGMTVNLADGTASDGDRLISIEGLYGSAFGDQLYGNRFGNFLFGSDGDDWLFGQAGADGLNGESGDDMLDGGSGNDVLNGASGSDAASYITAGAGLTASLANPSYNTGDASGDIYVSLENLMGSRHGDVLQGDDGNNIIVGLDGADLLEGFGGNDYLVGGAQRDWLFGHDGNDLIFGDEGDDVLYGGMNGPGPAYDTLNGGAGADRYVWNAVAEMGADGRYDLVDTFDAAEGDRIDLSAIDYDPVAYGRQRFTFVDRADPGRGQVGYDASTSYLVFNTDDDAAAEAFVLLYLPAGTPNASWFIL